MLSTVPLMPRFFTGGRRLGRGAVPDPAFCKIVCTCSMKMLMSCCFWQLVVCIPCLARQLLAVHPCRLQQQQRIYHLLFAACAACTSTYSEHNIQQQLFEALVMACSSCLSTDHGMQQWLGLTGDAASLRRLWGIQSIYCSVGSIPWLGLACRSAARDVHCTKPQFWVIQECYKGVITRSA